MKQLMERIKQYNPVNTQEAIDQKFMLTYSELFTNLLTRQNEVCHFTSSAFIVNETCSKVLMVHHNIYNSYSLVGGHVDGSADMLATAYREIRQETGVQQVQLLHDDIISLDILPVIGHYKEGVYVSPHLHLSLCYLFMATEGSDVRPKADENGAVDWLPLATLDTYIEESHMLVVYDKIKAKVHALQGGMF
jgi:8-oxo-dGTP pyrophosphatase MutT (NUDIX family)